MNEKLKKLRKEMNVTQKFVAESLGLSIRAISNYEQGIREPTYEILKKLCKFYCVSADYLLGLTD